MAQFEFVEWLVLWLLKPRELEFDWDDGNQTKSLQKHGIKIESVEQFFLNRECLVPLGIQVSPSVDEPRFGALGMDLLGNQLFVSFTIRKGQIRVISIRPMSQVERKQYASIRSK